MLVSSHLLSEMALMADDLVVIGRGRLIEQGPVDQFIDRHATRWVRVRTPTPAAFAEHLAAPGATYEPAGPDGIDVHGLADRARRRAGGARTASCCTSCRRSRPRSRTPS